MRKYIWSAIGVLVVLLAAGVFWAFSGNQGQIATTPDKKSVQTPTFQDFNGTYMTFRYSGRYQLQKLPAKDADLELAMLSANTNYTKQLAVSVSRLAGGSLNSNSAYLLRQSQPSMYTSHQVEVAGDTATVWVKADNLEQTVFIPHGDKVAVLSFSTVGTSDNLQSEVDTLLKTFHWKGM